MIRYKKVTRIFLQTTTQTYLNDFTSVFIMGNPFLLQACLRLDAAEVPKPLVLGKEYHFRKEDHRLYQLQVPMDLRTTDWTFLGRIIITEYTIGKGRTEGTFVLVKDFSEEEKKVITKAFMSDEDVAAFLEHHK